MPITLTFRDFESNTREWIIIALEEAFVNHPLFRISSGSQAPEEVPFAVTPDLYPGVIVIAVRPLRRHIPDGQVRLRFAVHLQ